MKLTLRHPGHRSVPIRFATEISEIHLAPKFVAHRRPWRVVNVSLSPATQVQRTGHDETPAASSRLWSQQMYSELIIARVSS